MAQLVRFDPFDLFTDEFYVGYHEDEEPKSNTQQIKDENLFTFDPFDLLSDDFYVGYHETAEDEVDDEPKSNDQQTQEIDPWSVEFAAKYAVEYLSDDELYNDGCHEMTDYQLAHYIKRVEESDGFDAPYFPNISNIGIIIPDSVESNYYAFSRLTRFVIDRENKTKGTNLSLLDVLKVNLQVASPFIYYITFKAEDCSTGEIDIYETKVMGAIVQEESVVTIFRKKKPKPEMNTDSECISTVSCLCLSPSLMETNEGTNDGILDGHLASKDPTKVTSTV